MFYTTIAAKLAVGFLFLLLYLFLTSRARPGPLSVAGQAGNFILGGIIAGATLSPSVSVLGAAAVIAIWGALLLLLRFIARALKKTAPLAGEQTVLLFDNGHILTENLRSAGVSAKDFIRGMRLQGVHRLSELQSVWLQEGGQYILLKKGEAPFPIPIIEDGAVLTENLAKIEKDAEWLGHQLARQGVNSPAEVFYAEWYRHETDRAGRLSVYTYQARTY